MTTTITRAGCYRPGADCRPHGRVPRGHVAGELVEDRTPPGTRCRRGTSTSPVRCLRVPAGSSWCNQVAADRQIIPRVHQATRGKYL
jgi:hypothetical protein